MQKTRLCRMIAVAVLGMVLLSGCGTQAEYTAHDLGPMAKTMKILDGCFFQDGESLKLISGTEAGHGASSQVFIYDVDQGSMEYVQSLPGCISMTAFCDMDRQVFFSTIAANQSDGCKLYAYAKEEKSLSVCAEFNAKGIYAIAAAGDELIIGTSQPADLYGYDITSGTVRTICANVTEQPFIRSLSVSQGIAYLGIGTKADLLAVDCTTGECRSVLPETYQNEAFVYSQAVLNGDILLGMSPSYRVLRYRPDVGIVEDTGLFFENGSTEQLAVFRQKIGTTQPVRLLGTLLAETAEGELAHVVLPYKTCYYDTETGNTHGLNLNGIYEMVDMEGQILQRKDLAEDIDVTYMQPVEALVYDGILYLPWSRFQMVDLSTMEAKSFCIDSEPQASAVTSDGIYTANYTEATVWFYPFSTFAKDPEHVDLNDAAQFQLADIENQCRPSQMAVTPDGRYLIIATGPLYGKFGGAVSVYDLELQTLLYTQEHVVPDHGILSLAASSARPGTVWLGTQSYGENTSPPSLDEPAHLILWDILEKKVLMDIVPDENIKKVSEIAELGDSVYCITAAAHVKKYDCMTGDLQGTNTQDNIKELLVTTDGKLLGINDTTLFEIDKESLKTKVLADGYTFLLHLTEDPVTGKLYCFDDKNLLEFE